jgi:hypothetical protein
MANRNFASGGKLYSMHVMPVMVDCKITIGASGAVSSFIGPTVASVTQSGTGVYIIKLQDPYAAMLWAAGSMISPSSGVSGISTVEIGNASAPSTITGATIVVQTLNASDSAANAANGSTLQVIAIMNNSKVKTSING